MARLLLILFCTLLSTRYYMTVSLAQCVPDCIEAAQQIADGTATPPFAYRIFIPKLLSLWGITLETVLIYQATMFAIFYTLLIPWCHRWRASPAVVLSLICLATITMMPTWYNSIYTVSEWNLWLLALLVLPPWRRSAP